jgi:hypothetical protein
MIWMYRSLWNLRLSPRFDDSLAINQLIYSWCRSPDVRDPDIDTRPPRPSTDRGTTVK